MHIQSVLDILVNTWTSVLAHNLDSGTLTFLMEPYRSKTFKSMNSVTSGAKDPINSRFDDALILIVVNLPIDLW